ncbi:MAG: hypothetical protein SCK57_08835 [Bacillota bacterium]|nr:hypothetical protein [Bacillota bacterium]
MSGKVFAVLILAGVAWGTLGVNVIGPTPPLVFGWLPTSVISIFLTGIYASLINWLYFKNYGGENK